jgi:hypothetical protein
VPLVRTNNFGFSITICRVPTFTFSAADMVHHLARVFDTCVHPLPLNSCPSFRRRARWTRPTWLATWAATATVTRTGVVRLGFRARASTRSRTWAE